MDIERTTHDYIKLGNGITISVNSEAPDLTPAHTKVVGAIIEAVNKIEGFDEPTDAAIPDTGGGIYSGVAEADPKPEEPAGNPPASLGESAPKGKPKLMISIAKTRDQGTLKRDLKVISIVFENLYEVFDRDEERAMAFVECIGSTEFKGSMVASMDNGREVVVSESCYLGSGGYGELIKRAKQSIQWAATLAAIDCEITVY